MMKQIVKNYFGKAVMFILAMVMIISVAWMCDLDGSIVHAAEDAYFIIESQTGLDVTDNMIAPKPTTEGKETYIFAGYFADVTCKTPVTKSTEDVVYKKFVPAEIMSVKAQVTTGTTSETVKTDMRLVTTVDCLDYKEVGFDVYFNGATTPINAKTTTVYEKIVAAKNGNDFGYSPIAFAMDSDYFTTVNLVNIANKNFDKTFLIKPYWKTLDGTKVYGISRMARVSDSYNGIANIPVRIYENDIIAENAISVTYDLTDFTYQGFDAGNVDTGATAVDNGDGTITCTTSQALTNVNDMLVNLRFKVNSTASSNESFVMSGAGACDYLYKGYATTYNGSPDTSWYDASQTEFVISSPAEMYGFAKIVNDGTDNFKDNTVYMAADITINDMTVSEMKAALSDSEAEDPLSWTAIGYNAPNTKDANVSAYFGGTFDGKEHTIQGLYVKEHGMFGWAYGATIQNFSIKESYMNSSCNSGSIVNTFDGTMMSVFSNMTINSTNNVVGGLIGRTTNGTKTGALTSSKFTVSNCWYAGDITQTYNSGNLYCGGLVGYIVQGTGANSHVIQHSLHTGSIVISNTTSGKKINAGGLVGAPNTTSIPLVLSDCLVSGEYSVTEDTKATLSVGSVVGTNGSVTSIKDDTYVYATSQWNGNTVLGATNATKEKVIVPTSDYSNYKSYNTMELDYYDSTTSEGYWVVRSNDVPALKSFVTDWIDVAWYYDNNTVGTDTFTINTIEQLCGLADISQNTTFSNETIQLGKDIKANNGNAQEWTASSSNLKKWKSIGNTSSRFAGTFDGKGHTISGLYQSTTANYSGLFASTDDGSVVKDLRLINSYFTSTAGYMGSIAGQGAGTFDTIYSDAIVEGAGTQIAGIIGRVNKVGTSKHTINNCWFDGKVTLTYDTDAKVYGGGIAGVFVQGTLDITNCLNTGEITHVSDTDATSNVNYFVGGICGAPMNTSCKLTIDNCMNAGVVKSVLKDGTEDNQKIVSAAVGCANAGTTTLKGVFYLSESCDYVTRGGNGTIVWSGNLAIAEADISGVLSYINAKDNKGNKLDFCTSGNPDGEWVVTENGIPTLKSFTEEWIDVAWYYDTKNYDEGNHSFNVSTAEEFYGFSAISQNYTFENDMVNLSQDVVLDKVVGREWKPIGTKETRFRGTFDGNGYTISGVNVNAKDSSKYVGLFGYTKNNIIKNFTLTNSTFSGNAAGIGAIVGSGEGDLSGIYCDNSVKINSSTASFIGGIIAHIQDDTRNSAAERLADTNCNVKNCWFDGTINQTVSGAATSDAAGIIGFAANGTITIDNCLYSGIITVNYTGASTSKESYAGGLCGHHTASSNSVLTISSSLSAGTINASSYSKGYEGAVLGKYGGKETYTNVYGTIECYSIAVGKASTQPIETVTKESLYNTIENLDSNYWIAYETSVPGLKAYSSSYEVDENITWLYEAIGNESDPYVLSSGEELKEFGNLVNAGTSFAGEIVELANDIVVYEGDAKEWAKGQNLPTKSWTPIGTVDGDTIVNAFQGTFDGDGHAIRGLYTTDTAGTYLGLFRKIKDATVCNLRIENSYFNTNKATFIGSVAGGGDGTFDGVYSNTIVHGSRFAGGLIGRVSENKTNNDTKMILKNCHFDGVVNLEYTGTSALYSGGLVGYVVHGSTLIDTCLYTGRISLDYTCNTESQTNWKAYVGALCGSDNGTSTGYVQVKNCISAGSVNSKVLSASTSPEVAVEGMNQTIGYARHANSWAKNTYVIMNNTRTIESTGVTTKSDETFARGNNSLAANFDVDSSFEKETLYGYGAQMWTDLAFTNEDRLAADNAALDEGAAAITEVGPIWAAIAGELPVPATLSDNALEMTVGKPDTDLEGDGLSLETAYKITTVEELAGFALNSKSDNYAGKYVVLANDIIINEGEDASEWVDDKSEPTLPWNIAIGNAAGSNGKYFEGIFDGQNHTISGICFENGAKNAREFVGLFATTEVGSEVKNLRLRNSYFEQVGIGWVGSIIGKCRGTVSNVYSDAIVKSTAENVGGIIAMADGYNYKNASASIESRISRTVDNCWYAGEIILVDEGRYSGGMIGLVNQGEWTLNNCVFTGKITCEYTGTSYAYIGGMCGALNAPASIATSSKETKVTLNSCISAGSIKTANKDYGAGAFVGRIKAEVRFNTTTEGDTTTKTWKESNQTHVVMNNVFATRDSGYQEVGHYGVVKASDSAGNEYTATPTMSGAAVWTNNADRLIGYCTEEVVGNYTGGSLDFSTFVIREEGVPVPNNFTDLNIVTPITDVDTILALTSMDSTWTTKNAVNNGLGHYVLRTEGQDLEAYTTYLEALETQGFAPYTTLEETGTDGLYNVIYTKKAGEWLLNVLFVQNTGKITLTISNGFDSLSPDLEPEKSTTSGTVTLSMLQLTGSEETTFGYYYGNSFVFKLPNGHFVINDGGNESDMAGLMTYLRKEAGLAEDDTTSKIYIDAWTVTHQHNDHFKVMKNIVDNPKYAEQLVVNAIYLNEPNQKAMLCEEGTDVMDAIALQYRGIRMLKDEDRNTPKVYWCQTGQTYYFDGLTMNILQSQEQIPVESYGKRKAGSSNGTDFNTASTNMLFTTANGKKVLITGDSNYVNMGWMMEAYGSSSEMFRGINVYQVMHHGKNTSYNISSEDNTFTDYIAGKTENGKIDVSLFPCSVYYEYSGNHESDYWPVFPAAGAANKHLIEQKSSQSFNYGEGIIKVILSDEITAGLAGEE